MQEPENFLKEEWEVVILTAVILLSVICLGLSFARTRQQRIAPPESSSGSHYQPILNNDAFAFLAPNQDFQPSKNPFQFQIRMAVPETKQLPVGEKDAPTKTAAVQPVPEIPAIPADVVQETAPVEQQPVFRLVRKRLTFLYSQADNTGKTSAVVKISGGDGQEELHTPGTGEQVLGMTILAITTEKLQLLDASGRQMNVPFGETKTVVIREKQ
jgi:hypothetical protein